MKFSETYIGRLRRKIGKDLLQVPGGRIVLENQNGQVLLQKRSDFGIWGLPAGSAEVGESGSDSIRRETFEETGLALVHLDVFGYSSNPAYEIVTYPNGDQIHAFSLLFWSNHWTGEMIESNGETLELAFFDLINLPEVIPNHVNTLEKFATFKQTGVFQLD